MRVLVVGGYGLLGGYVVSALAASGHEVVGAGRSIAAAERRFPYARWIRADLRADSEADWRARLEGVQAVVNCAGALQDSPSDRLQGVHVEGLRALAVVARRAGVERFVHISAVGVSEGAQAFSRTKAEGEAVVKAHAPGWVIFRPGLILAPAAFGGSALLRGMAAFPFLIPAIHADASIQVVGAEDVAGAVVAALRPQAPVEARIELVGPTYALRDILRLLRAWLGLPPAPVIDLPPGVARLSGLMADALAWLGWRSPMRTTAVAQLAQGVRGEGGSVSLPGVRLRSLEALLAAMPSSVQERWFARLYFVKPLAVATLSLFWLASGVIGLARLDAAAGVLTAAGAPSWAAKAAVIGGAAVDVLLGAGVCVRRLAPWSLRGVLLVSAAYLISASIWRPDLWTDPLGPLLKVLPAAALACAVLAIMDER